MNNLDFFSFIDNMEGKETLDSSNLEEKFEDKISIGDTVIVKYKEIEYKAKVVHTYYDGDAINVVFDNKYVTFHVSHVKKVIE